MPIHRYSPKNSITQERLKELLKYDPETGAFTRLVRRGPARKGNIAGHVGKTTGYRFIVIDSKRYNASRLAFLYTEGYWPENCMDHINRVRDDNRWINLRHVRAACNRKNSKFSDANKSGVTGVFWYLNKKWMVTAHDNGKGIYLGYFKVFRDAVIARRNAEIKYGYDTCNAETSAAAYLKNNP